MFRFIFGLLANLWALLRLPWWSLARARAAGRSGWLSLTLDGASVELEPVRRFRLFRQHEPVPLHAVRRALALAAADPKVRGVVLTLRRYSGGGACSESWAALLERFRQSGKQLIVYLPDGAAIREYYIAAHADRIVMGPDARLAPLGFAVESPYLRSALGQLGVGFEVFARGDFKTAGESLVRDEMSVPQRQQLTELLDSQFETVVAAIAAGRGVDGTTAEAWIAAGPFGAKRALTERLIDGLAYEDEMKALLTPAVPEQVPLVSLQRYARRRRSPFRPLVARDYLAVVSVHGIIASEAIGGSRVADERTFSESMARVRQDPRALGLVLHIDSRGGSALASARMLHEVQRCAREKPVVSYFNDTAASGGYMIALGAQEIVAQPTSITGSIGVVAARLVVQGLLERLAIRTELVKRGARADMFSATHFMADDAKAAFGAELDEVYLRFLEQVAEGRRMSIAEVEPLAKGRIWSGKAAQQCGLVDCLGDFELALERLRARIGTESARRAEPRLVEARRRSLPRPPLGPLVPLLAEEAFGCFGLDLLALLQDSPRDRLLAWAPVAIRSAADAFRT